MPYVVEILSASDAVYIRENNDVIDCTVHVVRDGTDLGLLRYTAAAHDPEPHGQQLWADLTSGRYGAIAPFTPPVSTQE